MATRTQIQNLTRRIESLVARRKELRVAVIYVDVGEDERAAVERHYREHPEDRERTNTIMVQFVAPKGGNPAPAGAVEA